MCGKNSSLRLFSPYQTISCESKIWTAESMPDEQLTRYLRGRRAVHREVMRLA